MNLEDVKMLLNFIGGLGMFLYGMHVMADGLQKAAGDRTKRLMGLLTNRRILGVVIGALVTAIIQSSSATTVLVVGFVNAGILTLTQSVGVIMGANIGTTMTAWLVSMSEWGSLFSPELFAPLLLGIGAFFILFVKDERKREIGSILVGFGILFIGLSSMSGAIEPYRDSPIFADLFTLLGQSPLLGILVGAFVTAIIQSSSASLGILQALAINGIVTWQGAVFIALGQNIGTCATAMLSCAGAGGNAKRAAVIHLLFNCIGAVCFGLVMYVLFLGMPQLAQTHINSVEIAMFHTAFNVLNTIMLFPFAKQLVKLSNWIVKEPVSAPGIMTALDERMLEAPAFALEQVEEELMHMALATEENLVRATDALLNRDVALVNAVFQTEQRINAWEHQITAYLVRLNLGSLAEKQQGLVKNILYTASNLERVSDHCENLAELTMELNRSKQDFSIGAYEDLQLIITAARNSLHHAIGARQAMDQTEAEIAASYEKEVDLLERTLREKHIRRLTEKKCQVEAGVIFLDTLSNLERVSDHAMNVADYVREQMKDA